MGQRAPMVKVPHSPLHTRLISISTCIFNEVATEPESGRLASEASRPEFLESPVFQSRLLVLCVASTNITSE